MNVFDKRGKRPTVEKTVLIIFQEKYTTKIDF